MGVVSMGISWWCCRGRCMLGRGGCEWSWRRFASCGFVLMTNGGNVGVGCRESQVVLSAASLSWWCDEGGGGYVYA